MSSVRERFEGSNNVNSNERIGRGTASDFTGLKSADGFVVITSKREGRTYVWLATCTKPGCMCQGITFSHDYLVNGGIVKCPASGHDGASIEPVARRTYDAGVEQQLRKEVVSSPRQRAEIAARAAEQAAFEKEDQQ